MIVFVYVTIYSSKRYLYILVKDIYYIFIMFIKTIIIL